VAHVNIDKVLYTLETESVDLMGINLTARKPDTSRVQRNSAKSTKEQKPVRKGLARSAVAKIRINKCEYHIVVKGTREYVGKILKQGGGRTSGYGYHLKGDVKTHNGFASQEAAIERMLTKV